jgi:hypothetical protein
MAQAVQVFAAPGDPDGSLPVSYPGWTFDRWVYLPLWDWYLIVAEAKQRDPELGELLAEVSGSADPDDSPEHQLPPARLRALLEFVSALADEFADGVDLTEAQAARELGDYDSTVYAEMLRAMAQVLGEALRMGEPFRAWNE